MSELQTKHGKQTSVPDLRQGPTIQALASCARFLFCSSSQALACSQSYLFIYTCLITRHDRHHPHASVHCGSTRQKKILSRPRARRWFRQGQKRWNGKNGVECYVRIPHISPQIRIHITHQNWRRQHQESVCKARERSKGNAERQEKKRGPI